MKHGRVWLGFNLTVICAVTMMLAGCNTLSIFHKYKIHDDEATSILIDAKQRAILSVHSPQLAMLEENSSQGKPEGTDLSGQQGQPEKNRSEENKSKKNDQPTRLRQVIVCAEPSPDALSGLSRELSASMGNLGSVDNGIQFEEIFEEIVHKLGERNATIQLLRDGLYRQCEAYLNGMINEKQYKDLADRYIDGMVALLAIERITPNPADDKAGQSSTHTRPLSKEAIEAVRDITRAFLDKHHVDECIELLSGSKLKSGSESESAGKESVNKELADKKPADKESAIDMCLFIATSKLSEKDKNFIKSNVRDLKNALTENSDLHKVTNTALGTTKAKLTETHKKLDQVTTTLSETNKNLTATDQTLGKATDDLKATKEELATTNKNLVKTTGDLSNTNETFGETNAALNETKKELANTLNATNAHLGNTTTALDETKKELATTNKSLVKTTGDLSNTNAILDETTAALSETKKELANTLTATNNNLGKAVRALGETNDNLGKLLPKSDNQGDVNADSLNGSEAKTSQETNGRVPDEGETADQKSQQ